MNLRFRLLMLMFVSLFGNEILFQHVVAVKAVGELDVGLNNQRNRCFG